MKNAEFKKSVFLEAAKVSNLTLQIGESESLRQVSKEVEIKDLQSKKIKDLILKLKKTLREYRKLTGKGRGIAAIQIGFPLKIAVIRKTNKLLAIINPQITNISGNLLIYPEICMSANPIIAPVIRPAWIEFEYLDEEGIENTWSNKKNKLLNRVFQHEIDHMNGIINIDLVPSSKLSLLSDPNFFKNAKFEKVN